MQSTLSKGQENLGVLPKNRPRSLPVLESFILLAVSLFSSARADVTGLVNSLDMFLTQGTDNSFFTPASGMFHAGDSPDPTYTLSRSGFGSFVSPTTQVEVNTDILKYNYLTIDLLRRINETAFVGVFGGTELAVQHLNGTANNKLQLFERQIFNCEPVDMVCQDIYPLSVWSSSQNEFFNRMYLFCDPKDSKTYKQSYLYTVIDGSSIFGEPIIYDFVSLYGRSRGVALPSTPDQGNVYFVVQYDDSLWNAD